MFFRRQLNVILGKDSLCQIHFKRKDKIINSTENTSYKILHPHSLVSLIETLRTYVKPENCLFF